MTERPHESEFAAFYRNYVSLVPEMDVLPVLDRQAGEIAARGGVGAAVARDLPV